MNQQTLQFIAQNSAENVQQLALKGCKDSRIDMPLALQQIASRQIAKEKIPTWYAISSLLYPKHLSMEQCSSEQTARYKALLAKRLYQQLLDNKSINHNNQIPYFTHKDTMFVDLTGGFGVDFSFMASAFSKSVYVEQQKELCQIMQHNLPLLHLEHTAVVCCDAVSYLQHLSFATVIYIDPARRNANGGKTVAIADCTPNVLEIKKLLLDKSLFTIVKLSPMLDWHLAVAQLNKQIDCVREIHIVSVHNECKELVFVLSKQWQAPLKVYCVNNDEAFVCTATEAEQTPVNILVEEDVQTGQYLYEPHSAVMKTGCFAAIAKQYAVQQIAINSHLFVSKNKILNFPGRKFKIVNIVTMQKNKLKEHLQHIKQANITVRNFPLSVADLRKRLHIKDGGDVYIFATTDATLRKLLIICEKITT